MLKHIVLNPWHPIHEPIGTAVFISLKVLNEDVKMNQWQFHNALAFFRLITV